MLATPSWRDEVLRVLEKAAAESEHHEDGEDSTPHHSLVAVLGVAALLGGHHCAPNAGERVTVGHNGGEATLLSWEAALQECEVKYVFPWESLP